MSSKHSVGVIVGRFQTAELTTGHIHLISEVLKRHSTVVVFIGCSPLLLSQRNPLPYICREHMIREMFPAVSCHPIVDLKPAEPGQDDTKWNRSLDKKIHEIIPYGEVILYGSRDSFLKTYKGNFKSIVIEESPCAPATHNREETAKTPIDSADFRKGIIWLSFNHWPISYTTVDIAIHNTEGKWLVGKKYNQDQWRFIGGFSDADDESFEVSALREVGEETGLVVKEEDMTYICSRRIRDWRYEREEDQVKTLFFKTCVDAKLEAKGADDIEVVQWVTFEQMQMMVDHNQFVSEHKILFQKLSAHLDKQK